MIASHVRTMSSAVLATGAAMALAGCGSNDEPAPAPAPSAAAAASAAAAPVVPMQPGSYAVTSRIAAFDAPGVPPQQLAAIRDAMVGTASERTVCLGPQAAQAGLAGFAPQMADAPDNCTFAAAAAGPGRIARRAVCRQQGGTLELAMDGAVQGDQATMQLDMAGSGFSDGAKNMRMRMDVTARRTGAC